jgi:hypothetical protein
MLNRKVLNLREKIDSATRQLPIEVVFGHAPEA